MSSSEASDTEEKLTYVEIESMKAKDLCRWLKDRGCKRSGTKSVLVNRVWKVINGESTSESSDSESAQDVEKPDWHDAHWLQVQPHLLPPLSLKDVENYFLYKKNPVTGKKKKCHRQLTKAKRLAHEQNYVSCIMFHEGSEDTCFVKAHCKPSMRTGLYNLIVVLTRQTGNIEGAGCTCKAGESGVCAHVGALLICLDKMKNPCTGRLAVWIEPRPVGMNLTPEMWRNIEFKKTEKGDSLQSIKPYPGVYIASGKADSKQFLKDILAGLGKVNPECTLYKSQCVKPPKISEIMSVFQPLNDPIIFTDCNLKTSECRRMFETFAASIVLTNEDCEQIEQITRGQAGNPEWVEARTYLITASKFGSVCKRKDSTPPDCLLKCLRGYTVAPSSMEPLSYGRRMESKARKEYAQYHIDKCAHPIVLEERGLLINPAFPYLGASTDGLVNCEVCGTGLVEIKCPYNLRTAYPKDGPDLVKGFCSVLYEGNLKLKTHHNYNYQIQGQLAIYNLKWADFVIWTKKDLHVERISSDSSLWLTMLMKLDQFYTSAFVPELFTKRVMNGLPLFKM